MCKKAALLPIIPRIVLLALLLGPSWPTAMAAPLMAGTMGTYLVYLPLVSRNFVPGYSSPFGVTLYGNVDAPAGLDTMRQAGSRWVTTELYWSDVEPTAPVSGTHNYNWSIWDTKITNANQAGQTVFALFTGNPSWAAVYPGGPVTDTQSLVDIVTAMTERYDGDGLNNAAGSPVVDYWSFYAEPDNGDAGYAAGGKGYWGNNGVGFAAMLQKISPAIHNANPQAKVFIGGLAYDWFNTDDPSPGPFVRSFLTDTLQALASPSQYLDGIAFHYYPINTVRWPSIREKALEIQGIMNRNGASSLPLYVPEMGYWSDTVPLPNDALSSTPTKQAQKLVQMYVQGLSVCIREMSWLGVFDAGPATDASGLFFNGDLRQPKPSFTATQTLTQELYGYQYSRTLSAAGIEGYTFTQPGGQTKSVVWGQPGDGIFSIAGGCGRVVGMLGDVRFVHDGDPADQNPAAGWIGIAAPAQQPQYVQACP